MVEGLEERLAMEDERCMREALYEAELATRHGDVPIGCVIARDGEILARGHNRREVDADPTAHAELLALRAAASRIGHWRVEGCTLFVTLEPCPMCAGALVNARVARLVYGARDPKAGAVHSHYGVGLGPELNHHYQVRGGVLEAPAVSLLRSFFARLRAEGQK